MDIENHIRNLAKSSFWQSMYSASKENGVKLFDNNTNLSALQVRFLYWLGLYSTLYTELVTKEDKYLTEKVLMDDVRTDAYLIHRHKKHEALWEKYRREEVEREIKSSHPNKHKSGNMNIIDVDLRSE
jgi:hypothetical protein